MYINIYNYKILAESLFPSSVLYYYNFFFIVYNTVNYGAHVPIACSVPALCNQLSFQGGLFWLFFQ